MAEHDCCNGAMTNLVKGVVLGSLIGIAGGILYAPKSGRETRDDLRRSTEELLERAKQQYEHALGQIEKLAGREKDSFIEKKERLKKALDAVSEALKDGSYDFPRA